MRSVFLLGNDVGLPVPEIRGDRVTRPFSPYPSTTEGTDTETSYHSDGGSLQLHGVKFRAGVITSKKICTHIRIRIRTKCLRKEN